MSDLLCILAMLVPFGLWAYLVAGVGIWLTCLPDCRARLILVWPLAFLSEWWREYVVAR